MQALEGQEGRMGDGLCKQQEKNKNRVYSNS